jgi:chemotaxis protein MotB
MSAWQFPQCALLMCTALLVLAGCVSQQKYDTLDAQYQQLNQTMSAEVAANQMQITRLRDAIQVTVNNELLFPSGDWQMSVEAQQTLSKIVPILAPKQQAKLKVNGSTDNVPIGPGPSARASPATWSCPRSGLTPSCSS